MEEGNYVVDPVTGEIVDPETGEVIDDHPIDVSRLEKRIFGTDSWLARSRTSRLSLGVHDSGLYTVVSEVREKMKKGARSRFERLARLQRSIRVSTKKEKKLVSLLALVWDIGKKLGFPKHVIERACVIARKLSDVYSYNKKNIDGLAGVSLYAAAKEFDIPIPISRFVAMGIDSRSMFLWLDKAHRLGLVSNRVIDPRRYIPKIVSDLGLPGEVTALATRVLEAAMSILRVCTRPSVLAAAAVYIASNILCNTNIRVPQKRIASIIGASEMTLRHRYRDIVDFLRIEVLL